MIQPINALTPRVVLRGGHGNSGTNPTGNTSNKMAIANAVSIAVAAGGLTTLVARAYTNSFAHAGVLGVFGAFLTGFFMTPHLIEKIGLGRRATATSAENALKTDAQKVVTAVKEHAAPLRRIPFRSA